MPGLYPRAPRAAELEPGPVASAARSRAQVPVATRLLPRASDQGERARSRGTWAAEQAPRAGGRAPRRKSEGPSAVPPGQSLVDSDEVGFCPIFTVIWDGNTRFYLVLVGFCPNTSQLCPYQGCYSAPIGLKSGKFGQSRGF